MLYEKRNVRMNKRVDAMIRRCAALLLSVAMIITMIPLISFESYAEAGGTLVTEHPVVLVTGTGLIGNNGVYTEDNVSLEKAYTLDQLKTMGDGSVVSRQKYSGMRSQSPYSKKYLLVNGVKVSALLGKSEASVRDDVHVLSSDREYDVSFMYGDTYTNSGTTRTVGLNVPRYFYDFATGERGEQVPAVIGWAAAESGTNDGAIPTGLPAGEPKDLGYLRLYCGQVDAPGGGAGDMNYQLFNGDGPGSQVDTIVEGEEITETAVTVGIKEYTRADILLMDRAENTYTFENQTGIRNDLVRGVPISVLLDGEAGDSYVLFETADKHTVDANGLTVQQLIDGNYMLAYESNKNGKWSGIYSDTDDEKNHGFLTLYGESDNNGDGKTDPPAKMITRIMITRADGIDYDTSPYKHVTNGGHPDRTGPYNIDSITGATLTIEGPAVRSSVPLSVRDFESRSSGYARKVYTDERNGRKTTRTYEGMDLYYLLHNMTSGKNGIVLTDTAAKVTIKDRNRNDISTFDLSEVARAHDDGRPILIAYGTAYENGTGVSPFVYDGATGMDRDLGNEDGCLKLVYDTSEYGNNTGYKTFHNMAYVYVEEDRRPGFKHTGAGSPYDTVGNTQTIISITGDTLGREVNYTIEDIENMVSYDSDGEVVHDGFGERKSYSMTNTAYWYVNEYEGVRLWSLLLSSGLDPDLADDDETVVNYLTSDNYSGTDKFTLKQIADDELFGKYEKNADDNNDGSYVPVPDDLKDIGYPVLLAYGVNGYPYVADSQMDGYLSGLDNDGGPVRVISGKLDYSHNNGSKQAQLLSGIVVGTNEHHFASHKYHTDGAYRGLADSELTVRVNMGEGAGARTRTEKFTVGDIEDLVYGNAVSSAQVKEAMVKAKYSDGSRSDLYEGVGLAYFLQNVVEMPGAEGVVRITGAEGRSVEMPLEELLAMNDGYNAETGVRGLVPVLAYGKNGTPLVSGTDSDGYIGLDTVAAGTDFEQSLDIYNNGGPLQLMIPADEDGGEIKTVAGVSSIEIDLVADQYAHTNEPYSTYADDEITISGAGTRLTEERSITVEELECKQSLSGTYDFSIRDEDGNTKTIRFRGVRLYDFLRSSGIGLRTNADKVVVTCKDGSTLELGMLDVLKSDYINSQDESADYLPVILAFGSAPVTNEDRKTGKPLVESDDDDGYDSAYDNGGGPVRLIIGQTDADDVNAARCLDDIVSIEVTGGDTAVWNHSTNSTFAYYLDRVITFEAVDTDNKVLFSKDLTIRELEDMTNLVIRTPLMLKDDEFFEWEGLELWGLISTIMRGVSNISDPVAVSVSAGDRTYDVMEQSLDAIKNGVADGDERYPIMLAYGYEGVPLAQGRKDKDGPGYDPSHNDGRGNGNGPIRLVIYGDNGDSLGNIIKVQVKVRKGGAAPVVTEFDTFAGSFDDGQLPKAGLRSVVMDKDGGLWIGTYGGGAAYKAKGADRFTVYSKNSEPALRTDYVSAIYPDAYGGIYMSQNASYMNPGDNQGLAYMKDGRIVYYTTGQEDDDSGSGDGDAANPQTVPDNYVQEIKIDDDGIVWIGSFGGLTKYDPAAGTWQTWNKSDGFPAMSVDNIEFDGNGGIWCGFYPDSDASDGSKPFIGGFAYFKDGEVVWSYDLTAPEDGKTSTDSAPVYRLGDVWIRDIAVDSNGAAWIVASGSNPGMANTGGVVYYVSSPGAEPVVRTGFELFGKYVFSKDSELRMVTVDPDGGIWFGTSKDGVFYAADSVMKDGKLTLTEQYASVTGSWSADFDNVYSLDFYGSTLYAGSSGGLATHKFRFSGDDDDDPSPAGKTTSISNAKVVLSASSYTYNGKVIKPSVKTIGGRKLDKDKDYTIKYSTAKPKNVGSYTVTVTGKGKYSGTARATFKINPKGTKVTRLSKARKAITVKWKKQSGKMAKSRITGYQIQLATDKKFKKNKKTITVKGYKKASKKVTKLKAGKKYYVRVRTYMKVSGKTYYSGWSKAKAVKTK